MRSELDDQEIERIAKRVADLMKPLFSNLQRHEVSDNVIFTVHSLADYLHVDPTWVYKQVSLKAIPYFKSGKYTRFRKHDIEKWVDSQVCCPIPHTKTSKI